MADFDDDAPDVDYEGEEEEEVSIDNANDAAVIENQWPPGGRGEGRAGDSETDDDDNGALGRPRPPPATHTDNNNYDAAAAHRPLTTVTATNSAPLVAKMDRALDAPRDDDDDETSKILYRTNDSNDQKKGGNNRADDDRYDHIDNNNNDIGRRDVRQNNNHHHDQEFNNYDNNSRGGGNDRRDVHRGHPNNNNNNMNNHHHHHHHRGGGGGQQRRRWGEKNVGVYIPPAKRKLLEQEEEQRRKANESDNGVVAAITGKVGTTTTITPIHIQRQTWDDMRKQINGTINRLSPSTIKELIHTLFTRVNLIRGRGLLVSCIVRAVTASPKHAPVYASLMAVINTKLPECGELLVTRLILAFRVNYSKRNRDVVSSLVALLGHLFNQGMANELLSLQLLTVLLEGDPPTEDSIDVAVGYMCTIGQHLSEVSPAGVHAIMERLRNLLHEGNVGRKAQYRITSLLAIRKGGFVDYPIIPNEEYLDLVEREEQITFELGLDDEELKYEDELDIFSFDNEYDTREEEWKQIKAEILGEDDDDENDESGGSDDENEDENEIAEASDDVKKTVVIEDLTETDLVHLRRTIYLTIMSSATFEECTHKLAKMDIPPGRECELINMIIECCSQERTFLRYYGLVSGRFCLLNERWQTAFEVAFATQYNTIHRLETNKLRNVAKLFGHLLHSDSFSWSVLGCVHLNEDETTSSSRIFIKILVQEMAEAMGMVALKRRFDTDNPDPDNTTGDDAPPVTALTLPNSMTGGGGNGHHHHRQQQQQQQEAPILRDWFKGMFPKDNARNTRYAINFFTSIGLGPLTDGMREFLKNAPKLILAQAQAQQAMKDVKKMKEDDDDASSVISTSSSDTSSVSSSSSGSSMSSSSTYTSSSSSSYSSYRRKKSKSKGGRDRKRNDKRSRSYSSYSSSDDDADDSGGRKKHNRGDGRRRGGTTPDRRDRKSTNDGAGSMASSRSVSVSPVHAKCRGRSRRSYSSSRSRSPANKRNVDDDQDDRRKKLSNDNDEGRKKRTKLSS